ncbi:hypothetical protein C1I93_12630 [Micromonospora endophytica]|uniref:S1 motif domain-containing protein n=2 Tax=Micromonospora endophytica TaxID=515350 RepID=A0A2W2DIZ2_9ACTN|nr:hypothetical protein C1I93_12630 [Micromonospora endophytica]RIW46270.1 S1 RNA-binding domain-containing protein [Micromonospora endophytica]
MGPHKHSATIEVIDARERVLDHGRFATTTRSVHLINGAHRPLRRYSSAVSDGQPKRGTVVRGTVSEIRNFGVFVRIEGDPADQSGSGFIRIPELTWEYFDDPVDVVHVGQQISAEVLDFDTTREQVQLSLKALQDDPLVQFADRIGEVLSGPVVKVVPFGVFVRVAPGIVGLLHESVLTQEPAMGETVTVTIAEVDRPGRRVRLDPAPDGLIGSSCTDRSEPAGTESPSANPAR